MANIVATATTEITGSTGQVWAALTDPELIKKYMFGSQVFTDWHEGSSILWKGEYEGKAYEDKGNIVAVDTNKRLEVTHFSPLSQQEDVPENYHTLVYELEDHGDTTRVSLSQDNNASEEGAANAKGTWEMLLAGLKQVVESG